MRRAGGRGLGKRFPNTVISPLDRRTIGRNAWNFSFVESFPGSIWREA
jgi:hypothetical protein